MYCGDGNFVPTPKTHIHYSGFKCCLGQTNDTGVSTSNKILQKHSSDVKTENGEEQNVSSMSDFHYSPSLWCLENVWSCLRWHSHQPTVPLKGLNYVLQQHY